MTDVGADADRQARRNGGAGGGTEALLLSLGFWAALLAATALFALVSLAPRLAERATLERRFSERQAELLTLQREATHLRQVAEALEADSRLRQALSTPGEPAATGELTIPVSPRLRYDPRDAPLDPVDSPYVEPWYLPLVASFAASRDLRLRASLLAAALLAFGFGFLHEHAGGRAVGRALTAPLRWLANRYQRLRPPEP